MRSAAPAHRSRARRARRYRLAAGTALALVVGLPPIAASSAHAAPVRAAPAPAAALAAAGNPCGAGGNAIACENTRAGSPPSEWDIDGAGDEGLQGFATDISVDVGGRVDFKIDTAATDYDITIYRTGWYGGDGAREIGHVDPSASLPQQQPPCITDVATELFDCGNWAVSASWNVPATAVSGVYVAHLEDPATQDESHITFVVRDDDSTSDVIFQTSDTTWQAYNPYGGSDFYRGGDNGRAYKISYNRPVVTRDVSGGRDFYFANEYPMVRFLERNGYDVSYQAGVDTHRRGGLLSNHNVFLSVGHDEYWSGPQRQHVEAARDAGVNLQFLSGNEMYWRTRFEPSADASHTPDRTLVSYKETWANAKIDPAPEWTGTWRDPRFAPPSAGAGRTENELIGTAYMVNYSDLALRVSAREGRLRLWRHTPLASLNAGATATLAPHTVGYESNEDIDNGLRPPGLVRLSTTTGAVPEYLQDFGTSVAPGTTTHHLTLYRAASGALVFSAGSVQWTWGLDAEHDSNYAPEPADPRMQQAQVNLLADMEAQPTTLQAGLTQATASSDTQGPTTTISSPAGGAAVSNGENVTLTGTASDAGGQVAGVEVSTDDGATWRPATGTTSWTHTYIQHGQGPTTVLVRAVDDSANQGAHASVTLAVSCPCSVLGAEVPAVPAADDPGAVELGLRFSPATDGFVDGVRFFKGAGNGGTHTGRLWSASGELLATVSFDEETATGWQSARFSTSVPVATGETYVVSYTAPQGRYAVQNHAFTAAPLDRWPLQVAGGYGAEPAGVFADVGRFPNRSFANASYYVDALFTTTDESPLVVRDQWPQVNASSVPADTAVSATFSKALEPGTARVDVADDAGTAVPGSTTYDPATRTVTFRPDAPLAGFVKHAVTVGGTDLQGNTASAGETWSFRTARPPSAPGVCPCSLFDEGTVPTLLEDVDQVPVTLGVRFSADKPGSVTAIRFYKGSGNTGTHTGSLWTASGQLLAEGTFTDESASGWQEMELATPVEITPGTEYVAAYRAPVGRYSATPGAFSQSDLSRPPLRVGPQAGAYTYGTGFPSTTSGTSYLVDVVFEKAPPTIAVTTQDPAPGATDVPRGRQVRVWFSEPLDPGATLAVRHGGTPLAGTTASGDGGASLTFTPDALLPADAELTVDLRDVVSVEGAALPDRTWTFHTRTADPTDPVTLLGHRLPQTGAVDESSPVELGTRFSPSRDGSVTAIRFFKGAGNEGAHTGSLWTADGTRLATVAFTGETPSGWQRATLATPVRLAAGSTYVVSYLAPQGHYAASPGFFSSAFSNGVLSAPGGDNGRYLYGAAGGFPTGSWGSTNYFVDVEFLPDAPTVSVVSRSPAAGAEDVSLGSTVTLTVSEPLTDGTLALTHSGQQVPGTSTRSADDRTITFTPSERLPASATLTASSSDVVSQDGAELAPQSWSFTTEATATTSTTLFDDDVPQVAATGDASAVELGTAFSPSVAGEVRAIRFYKGSGNTGTHTGSLWAADGTRLAQVTFTGETATGWQTAQLETPVALSAGEDYVVSYLAPDGHYATTGNFFAAPWTSGPLTAPATDNGRYLYGADGGFPDSSYNRTNYFVDVVFRSLAP